MTVCTGSMSHLVNSLSGITPELSVDLATTGVCQNISWETRFVFFATFSFCFLFILHLIFLAVYKYFDFNVYSDVHFIFIFHLVFEPFINI